MREAPRVKPTAADIRELEAALAASRHREEEAHSALETTRAELDAIRGSRAFGLAQSARRGLSSALPIGSRRRRMLDQVVTWRRSPAEGGSPTLLGDIHLGRPHLDKAAASLPFSIVIVDGTTEGVRATRSSLSAQTWPHWSASTVASGADLAGRVAILAGSLPSQTLMVVLDAGDTLAPECLEAVASGFYRDPLLDLLCWDDVVVGANRPRPRHRPSWSPDTLLTSAYLGAAASLRAGLLSPLRDWPARTAAGLVWSAALAADLDDERAGRLALSLSVTRTAAPTPAESGAVLRHHLRGREDVSIVRAVSGGVHLAWRRPPDRSVSIVLTADDRAGLERLTQRFGEVAGDAPEVVVVGASADLAPFTTRFRCIEAAAGTSLAERRRLGLTQSRGDVLVFVDAMVRPPTGLDWLDELASLACRPGIGLAGPLVMDGKDRVVEAGIAIGLIRLAGRRLAGTKFSHASEMSSPLFDAHGLRNVSGVGAGCLAVRRDTLERAGPIDGAGGDGAFGLVLGTRLRRLGYRCVCTSTVRMRQVGSPLEPSSGNLKEEAALYWVIRSDLFDGDPYWSPQLSLLNAVPRGRSRGEPDITERLEEMLHRSFASWAQRMEPAEAFERARTCRADRRLVSTIAEARARVGSVPTPMSVTWFIPNIETPYYGGLHTALRLADLLARTRGVRNRFACWQGWPEALTRSALTTAFPALADAEVYIHDGSEKQLAALPPSDAGVATLWISAYQLAGLSQIARKFYLIQDFEPMFYPAGTMYALAEETYRLGLYGICNSEPLAEMYRRDYGGIARAFVPAIDSSVFHGVGRPVRRNGDPLTIFVYGRPGHWRNCWELASTALRELKKRHGTRVRLVTAGTLERGTDPEESLAIRSYGLLDYGATADLYRSCDIGLALTVSHHPSYLPLELMACGAPVVAFDNIHGRWLLHDGDNARLCELSAQGLVDAVDELIGDPSLRETLRQGGYRTIAAAHADWDHALMGIHDFMLNPPSH
jgi:glycosyltransferase involved in cell wall biosynthesis